MFRKWKQVRELQKLQKARKQEEKQEKIKRKKERKEYWEKEEEKDKERKKINDNFRRNVNIEWNAFNRHEHYPLIKKLFKETFSKKIKEKVRINHLPAPRSEQITKGMKTANGVLGRDGYLRRKFFNYFVTYLGHLDPFLIIELRYGTIHDGIYQRGIASYAGNLVDSENDEMYYLVTIDIKNIAGDEMVGDYHMIKVEGVSTNKKIVFDHALPEKIRKGLVQMNTFLETFLVKKKEEEEKEKENGETNDS
jgi:hypothetical protein